jgi:hypothetical protein
LDEDPPALVDLDDPLVADAQVLGILDDPGDLAVPGRQ